MAVALAWLIRCSNQGGNSRIQHIHAHFAHDPALVALLVYKLTGISFSFTAHARDLYQLGILGLQERSKEASAILTCCDANQDYLARVLPESLHAKVRVVHHGVDVRVFSPALPGERHSEEAIILSVGRLVEKKGFSDLLEAFCLLKQAGIAFRAVIYGDGPLQEKLEAQIKHLGLEAQVTLAGARKQEDLLPAFKESTLFALTPNIHADGDRDGIPNVLVEAMACGLPVVSTAVAGVPELVIHDQNGLLYRPHDVKGIAEGMAALIDDADLRKRLGEAARQTVLDHFDLKSGAGQIAGLFQQMGAA
jgi:glycosyltransferase involved in cell wall biosynthesis